MALPSRQSAPWVVGDAILQSDPDDVVEVIDEATRKEVVCRVLGPYAATRAALFSAAPEMATLIYRCRDFIAGFEDDPTQTGIGALLNQIDDTMLKASGQL